MRSGALPIPQQEGWGALSLKDWPICRIVLANDAQDISGDKHIGYLVGKGKSVVRYEDKQSIACGIVQHLTNTLKGIP